MAGSLTNIAGCYQFLRRYDEAIPLYRRALEIYEDLLGPIHADVAVTTNDLAVLHFTTGNTDQAEKLYKKALHVYEKIFGPHHPDVGQVRPLAGPFLFFRFCALDTPRTRR
jgi:tetratricopeptide (TPR) repeat protein